MHLLLFISVILVVISSFLISLCAESKKFYVNSCYFWGILFGQVVLGFEILSVPEILTPLNFLIINAVFFIFSIIFYLKKSPEILIFEDFKDDILKIKHVIAQDKWLKVLFIAFCIFLAGTLTFVIFMPVYDPDSYSYHLARVPFWVINHSLNHFLITDIRALIMPINSEIIYAWAFMFIKSDIFVRVFSFCAYLLFVAGLRGLFKELKLPLKTFIWTLFIVTSMPSVLFSVSGTESNTAIAALILSAIYLFLYAVKRNKIIPVYFSSLLYALAIGTKTTALISSFSVLLIATVIAYLYKRKDFYKPLLICGSFLFLNFIIFASYNYILNFAEFGSPLSSVHARESHAFYGGFKAFIANIIRYIFDIFDFSQFPGSIKIWRIENAVSKIFLAVIGIDPDTGLLMDSKSITLKYGHDFENLLGMGIFGFLLFLPSVYLSVKSFGAKSLRTKIISAFAIGFIVNFLILSVTMGYMVFSIRFLVFFALIACPSLVYVMNFKKFRKLKIFSGLLIIYSFVYFYYFYQYRYTPYLMYLFYKHPGIQNFKNHIRNASINWEDKSQSAQIVEFLNQENNINALFFVSNGSDIYTIVTGQGKYKADFMSLESAEENSINWDKYDYIFVTNIQLTSLVQNLDKFKKYTKSFSDGNNLEFEYSPELFANCYYLDRKDEMLDWVNSDKERVTKAACYIKQNLFEKHGFKMIKRFDAYEKNVNGIIYVFKKQK